MVGGKTAVEAIDLAIDVYAGYGYFESDLERWYRFVKAENRRGDEGSPKEHDIAHPVRKGSDQELLAKTQSVSAFFG